MTTLPFAPPRPPWSRRRRMVAPLATIGTLALATVALRLRDPHVGGSWGLCPSAALGFACPGCGGLRAVNDLTHGRVLDAASSNLFLVVAAPFVVLLLARWVLDAWRGTTWTERAPRWTLTTAYAVVLVGALAVFTVLRNLPPFAWLAP